MEVSADLSECVWMWVLMCASVCGRECGFVSCLYVAVGASMCECEMCARGFVRE